MYCMIYYEWILFFDWFSASMLKFLSSWMHFAYYLHFTWTIYALGISVGISIFLSLFCLLLASCFLLVAPCSSVHFPINVIQLERKVNTSINFNQQVILRESIKRENDEYSLMHLDRKCWLLYDIDYTVLFKKIQYMINVANM